MPFSSPTAPLSLPDQPPTMVSAVQNKEPVNQHDQHDHAHKTVPEKQVPEIPTSLDPLTIQHAQQKDPHFGPIYAYCQSDLLPSTPKLARRILVEAPDYFIENGLFYKLYML